MVVLGHVAYYPRFGFRKASLFGLGNEYGVDEEFMVLELRPGTLPVEEAWCDTEQNSRSSAAD